jgi:predicted glycogen debranching enzyme
MVMAPVDFGREICSNLETASQREWLVTNGIGGYAAGTLSGILTRSYHGYLIAALQPPLGRYLLLAKLDETVSLDGHSFPLFANRWASGVVEPQGYLHLERFYLDGSVPVWIYTLKGIRIEKRLWMEQGENTTWVLYKYLSPYAGPESPRIDLSLKTLVNYRNHHAVTRSRDGNRLQAQEIPGGMRVIGVAQERPFYLVAGGPSIAVQVELHNEWDEDFYLDLEAFRGLEAVDDHLEAGVFHACLDPGESLLFMGTTELPEDTLDENTANEAVARQKAHENEILAAASGFLKKNQKLNLPAIPEHEVNAYQSQLVLAADQFIVKRQSRSEPQGSSVIAGYPWFGDWGRDTMISLPGLALVTGRPAIARRILRTFADYVDQGMLPNRFPDEGETPEYNTVDATLWYFEALRAYLNQTQDQSLLQELYPVLTGIVDWHLRGTRYQIHTDPQDGLLYAGEPGVQLTWMDAKVDDWVVTPRSGKPVEINALWYNALMILSAFAAKLGKASAAYAAAAQKARQGFNRFWNEALNCCYDVIDGPQGDDPALRPNQLLAVSLTYSPLAVGQQKFVLEACRRSLLTSHGLRSLAPDDPAYIGGYGGSRRNRDAAYHQGTVWAWLIGPFISAYLKVYRDPQTASALLVPFFQQLKAHGLGSLSEIYDGNAPFTPRGCFAQAWSVAEVLRVLQEIIDFKE